MFVPRFSAIEREFELEKLDFSCQGFDPLEAPPAATFLAPDLKDPFCGGTYLDFEMLRSTLQQL